MKFKAQHATRGRVCNRVHGNQSMAIEQGRFAIARARRPPHAHAYVATNGNSGRVTSKANSPGKIESDAIR